MANTHGLIAILHSIGYLCITKSKAEARIGSKVVFTRQTSISTHLRNTRCLSCQEEVTDTTGNTNIVIRAKLTRLVLA